MSLSISGYSPYLSIYRDSERHNAIDKLISGALCGAPLHHDAGDGKTYRDYLYELSTLARDNHQESIELLQNLALGEGEVAAFAQDTLCQIVCRADGGSYEAARTVRDGCQMLMTGFGRLVTDETLSHRPKLVFAASTAIQGDGATLEAIPLPVKEKVNHLQGQQRKPKWFTPDAGMFKVTSYQALKAQEGLVRYSVPKDGACQFRAAFALRDNCDRWIHTDKSDILREIKGNGVDSLIKKAILVTVRYLDNANMLPAEFTPFFRHHDFTSVIYNNTIANLHFSLYSPEGIDAAIIDYLAKYPQCRPKKGRGKPPLMYDVRVNRLPFGLPEQKNAVFYDEITGLNLDSHERTDSPLLALQPARLLFLETLADGVGEYLYRALRMDVHSHPHLYAELCGQHYDIIVSNDNGNFR